MQLNQPGTLESRMHGNVPVRFGKGLSEKGRKSPRREPTSSFKRAAVKLGVARYLYRDGVPKFVQERTPTPAPAATPREEASAAGAAEAVRGVAVAGTSPRTGKALFAWTKDQEQRYQVGLLKYLNQWAKLREFPGRMVDWDTEQVALAFQEACRKLQALSDSAEREAYQEAIAN